MHAPYTTNASGSPPPSQQQSSEQDNASLPPTSFPVFTSIPEYRAWRREKLLKGETVGLVPTMGALHAGHLDLVRAAQKVAHHPVLSIFVNPAQFAPHEDLARYPRTLPDDLKALEDLGKSAVSAVLVPQVHDMYPLGITLEVDKQRGAFVEVKGFSLQMEGITRPHFFRGVATVVSKLFNIFQPDHVFFGQKDVQQCVVIRNLIRDLHFPIEMHIVPTTRHEDGLAMSSRNKYLTSEQRPHATVLHDALELAAAQIKGGAIQRDLILRPAEQMIREKAKEIANPSWDVKLDYLSLVKSSDLQELDSLPQDESEAIIVSGAMWVGSTRLIDNVVLGKL
ncbi:hypothetical protein BZG36_03769 [Bifiguratus adelaidae]|uniref:Pantoate--beta-alanine ligase n=1 Tax=Bifiguratus adelaidae TaxID=1938954 RepID=A0A261Y0A9_9FUNG|nr:hypothetical protein BZG36_03769 [Bifiguratus adelaidae]